MGGVLIQNPSFFSITKHDELVKLTLNNYQTVSSTQILDRTELLKEGGELAEQAAMDIISTPKANFIGAENSEIAQRGDIKMLESTSEVASYCVSTIPLQYQRLKYTDKKRQNLTND